MKNHTTLLTVKILLAICLALFLCPTIGSTCTRIVYQSSDNKTFTARTMDWDGDMKTNIWVFPRGIHRNGAAGKNSFEWTSKYGSVVASAYDFATCDGMNEKGLSANFLWLSASKFPVRDGKSKEMSLSIFAQYLLDSYATVGEAVEGLEKNEFIVLTMALPGQRDLAGIHISLSDSFGDNAIIEFVDGKMAIHHNREYNVLTNDPIFEKQLVTKGLWEHTESKVKLPGTYSSSDRFVRASHYTGRIPKTIDKKVALSAVFAMIRGISIPQNKQHDILTIWRTVADHDSLTYHFESAENPYNMFWVDFSELDFSENAPVKILEIAAGKSYIGNATSFFVDRFPFKFFDV